MKTVTAIAVMLLMSKSVREPYKQAANLSVLEISDTAKAVGVGYDTVIAVGRQVELELSKR